MSFDRKRSAYGFITHTSCVVGIIVTVVLATISPVLANSANFDKLMKQGEALSRTGRKQEAFESLTRAVKMRPKSSNAHAELGWVLYELGQLDKAADEERKAIQLNAKNADAYHHLGSIYLALNKMPEAAQEFRMSLSLDPSKRCNCGPIERLIMTYASQADVVPKSKKR